MNLSSLPVLGAFALAAFALVGEASAGTLYRCVGKDGVTAFTSSRTGYSQCKLVGNFPDAPKAAAKPANATPKNIPAASGSTTAPTSQVEFRTAAAGAEPKPVAVPEGAPKPKVQRGAVYKYEKNGVTHYTNRRPAGQRAQVLFTYIETCFACSPGLGLDFNSVGLNVAAFNAEIAAAAALHGVDAALVRAVIHAESAFNPNAVSRAGAQGLMQLMPATAARFGVTEPFTPEENINGGVSYLAWLLKRFDGDITRVSAAYNAGEGAVDKYDGVPPYAETQVYVERVGILHERYKKELASATALATNAAGASATASATTAAAK
jgi:soluble lytic murein transglycosylase-like protein